LQWERDYVAKRSQYENLGIPEYWIINPQTQGVLVLRLTSDGFAEVGSFAGDDPIQSCQFPTLSLTAAELFASGQTHPW
jgi:Uma2 family endonuclease